MTADLRGSGRVLVVDDERPIVDFLGQALGYLGYDVATAGSGEQALAAAREQAPDCVVLDVMMPGLDGFAVVQALRESGLRAPVVFLTARDGTADKVRGLALGADDYVTKPFALEELLARVQAVLRRTQAPAGEPARLLCADLVVDLDSCEVSRGGEPAALSPTEYRLLCHLLRNQGRVLSKRQLLDQVWGYEVSGDSNLVEAYVSSLRRKVDARGPRLLHTVRGLGYVVRPPR